MNISTVEITSRRKKYQAIIQDQACDALLISSPATLYYLTNYLTHIPAEREAVAVLTAKDVTLYLPSMYKDQAALVSPTTQVEIIDAHYWQVISNALVGKRVAFEAGDLLYAEFDYLKRSSGQLIPLGKELITPRLQKTAFEIDRLTEAEKITQIAYKRIISQMVPGVSEKEVAHKLDDEMEKLGADSVAFPTIVAFGQHSAVPHHAPTQQKLEANNVILVDMGAKKDGYCGDLTRTIVYGTPTQEFMNAYTLVLQAQQQALNTIKAGIPSKQVDEAVREVFTGTGQGAYFIHTTGHGLGIEVHEAPSLSYLAEGLLAESMVITVEPGLYYPQWGGVRIEDVVVVTKNGWKPLSSLPKGWNQAAYQE